MASPKPSHPPRLHTARCRDQERAGACDGTCVTRGDRAALVAFDIDGVLAPEVYPLDRPPSGFVGHPYSGPNSVGQHIDTTVYLHPEHGRWMTELVDHGAELAWASTWRAIASQFIVQRLGLPASIPFIDVGAYTGVRFGHSRKQPAVADAAGDRPLAWLDDHFGGKDEMWADERTAAGIPTLLIHTDSGTALRREHIDMVIIWLEAQKLSPVDTLLDPWQPVRLPHHEQAEELLAVAARPGHQLGILHHFVTERIHSGTIDSLKLVLQLVQGAGRYAAHSASFDGADEHRCLRQAIEKIPEHIETLLTGHGGNDETAVGNAIRLAVWAIGQIAARPEAVR
jgi:hypothetical protein